MLAIVSYAIISAIIGLLMYRRQNNDPHRLGGAISKPKALWLYYTISVWFFLLPYVTWKLHLPDAIKYSWLVLSISMWVRGIIELYMLFVTKNWTPPIGIGHDILTFLGMAGAVLYFGDTFAAANLATQVFTISLLLSLAVETYYAFAFFQLVRERTKGGDAIWYASEEDPKFKRIVFITACFNTILFAALFYYLYDLCRNLA